jgi:uncharacterized BrkB/YihY/UPF0761 family membrane protein
VDLVWEFAHRFRRNNGAVLAGYLAYRLFVWFAPLALVLVGAIGFSQAANIDLVRYATEYGVPEDEATEAAVQASRGRVVALIVGLGALAWTTLGLIRGVHYAFAQAWGMEIRPRKRLVRQVGYVMLSAFLLVVLFAAVGALQQQGPLFALVGVGGSAVLVAAALWCVCWTMPRRTRRWYDLVPGVAAGTVGTAAVQTFMAIYLPQRVAGASELYGSLGVALALLFYMFLLGYLLVGTALINSVWTDRAAIIAGRPWVLDPDALPRWLQRPARWASNRRSPAEPPPTPADDQDAPGRPG